MKKVLATLMMYLPIGFGLPALIAHVDKISYLTAFAKINGLLLVVLALTAYILTLVGLLISD